MTGPRSAGASGGVARGAGSRPAAAPLLHHRVEGPEGRPVLVLGPSLGTTTAVWDAQVPALAQVFRVVRWDLPGHGRSPAWLLGAGGTVAHLARLVLDLVDALVVAGRDDVATPPAHARALADGIADAALVELPRTGHLAPVERPEPVLAALLAHFAPAAFDQGNGYSPG
ncbi:alpha/beta hydrolase [Streptomyces sp. WAC 06738]|uniref:alpha/beta hydrolase n=1 Tax=Streptomyces sp. WAC 06738 TaxID=2203210 RepID=UPI0026D18367